MSAMDEIRIPDEFHKIINDFVSDIKNTFPEYEIIIQKWWPSNINSETSEKRLKSLFKHCLKIFPERFFDILYKNADIFSEDSDVSTEFLPGIVFKQLWTCDDVSENTRETIWKYLQLVLFAVVGNVKNTSDFGDSAKLFETMNDDELKGKLQEVFENMQTMFSSEPGGEQGASASSSSGINMENMPNPEELHTHIHNMMDGKLGKLAMELAEETARDLNIDMENAASTQDVLQQLFKNPTKLMNMVKTVGGKLDDKLKSGELNETELLSESMNILNRMKSMPGMQNMQEMFSKMGIPGLGKGAKLDMNAMEAEINRKMKSAQTKDRMRANLQKKQEAATISVSSSVCNVSVPSGPVLTDDQLISMFDGNINTAATAKPVSGKKKKSKK